jgi:hypothetical protein
MGDVYKNWEKYTKNPSQIPKTPTGLAIMVPWIPKQ